MGEFSTGQQSFSDAEEGGQGNHWSESADIMQATVPEVGDPHGTFGVHPGMLEKCLDQERWLADECGHAPPQHKNEVSTSYTEGSIIYGPIGESVLGI